MSQSCCYMPRKATVTSGPRVPAFPPSYSAVSPFLFWPLTLQDFRFRSNSTASFSHAKTAQWRDVFPCYNKKKIVPSNNPFSELIYKVFDSGISSIWKKKIDCFFSVFVSIRCPSESRPTVMVLERSNPAMVFFSRTITFLSISVEQFFTKNLIMLTSADSAAQCNTDFPS